jgi:hypothetical protein
MFRRIASALFGAAMFALLFAIGMMEAKADVFQSSTGLTSPGQVITFDEVVLPPDTLLTNQYSSYGITFNGAIYDPYAPPSNNGPNVNGNVFGNFIPSTSTLFPLSTLSFATPVTEASLALYSQPGITTISTYLSGSFVESHGFSTDLSSTNNYYGFNNSLFDSMTISVASSDRGFIADNVQFSEAVPEPGVVATLAGLGCFSAAMLRLRKKRSRI